MQLYLQHLLIWCNYLCRGQFQAINVKSQNVGMGGDGHSTPSHSVYTEFPSHRHSRGKTVRSGFTKVVGVIWK